MNAASDVAHLKMSSIVTEGKDDFIYKRLLRARYDEKDICCAHFHEYIKLQIITVTLRDMKDYT